MSTRGCPWPWSSECTDHHRAWNPYRRVAAPGRRSSESSETHRAWIQIDARLPLTVGALKVLIIIGRGIHIDGRPPLVIGALAVLVIVGPGILSMRGCPRPWSSEGSSLLACSPKASPNVCHVSRERLPFQTGLFLEPKWPRKQIYVYIYI